MFNLQFKQDIKLYQNKLVNLVSLSVIGLSGTPYLHTQFSKNNLAHVAASTADVAGIKHTSLLNLSTTVIIASYPRLVIGS